MEQPIEKNKLLAAFKADLRAAETLKKHIDAKILERRSVYQGLPYGNEEDNKSKIVPKVAKRQSEWAHASLKDPFVSTPDIIKCSPVTYEDTKAAQQNELLLNYQFCRQFDRYNFLTKALKVLDVDATLFVQTGWEYHATSKKRLSEVPATDVDGKPFTTYAEVEDLTVHVNRPTAKVCRSEDIFVDPTCQDNIDKAQFVIYRYETDMSTLMKDGRYTDLDKVTAETSADYDYRNPDKTYFKFSDKPRKKMLVYEYWGNYDLDGDGKTEAIVCTWIGDVIIRLEENPYPDKKPPFLVVPFSSVPFHIHGENNIDLISDQQKVVTAITRGIINNMAQSTNGQVGIKKGALDLVQRKKFLDGKNFEFNGSPTDFWQGSYNQIPSSAFDMLTLMNNEVESLTGIKGFNGGLTGNSLGATATGTRGVLDATSVRRLDLVRNLAENLIKPLMRKWMAYNAEFLSEEEVIRITNDEFVPIRRDDLDGNIDIDITISTAEDNASKAQELTFLLQTLGNSVPFEFTQMILAKMARLQRMPDLEQQIKHYQPKTDPAQEQLKQLQLQEQQLKVQKLQAEIAAMQASTREDTVDLEVKKAKAAVEVAKARKLHSDADMQDLNFLRKDEGVDHAEKMQQGDQAARLAELIHGHKMEQQDHKRLGELDKSAFDSMHRINELKTQSQMKGE